MAVAIDNNRNILHCIVDVDGHQASLCLQQYACPSHSETTSSTEAMNIASTPLAKSSFVRAATSHQCVHPNQLRTCLPGIVLRFMNVYESPWRPVPVTKCAKRIQCSVALLYVWRRGTNHLLPVRSAMLLEDQHAYGNTRQRVA